jgi:hypothetical protein
VRKCRTEWASTDMIARWAPATSTKALPLAASTGNMATITEASEILFVKYSLRSPLYTCQLDDVLSQRRVG